MKKLLAIRKQKKSTEQGFSIAVSTGFGLIIMMIGLTLMGRALKDSSVSASQKTISRSDAAAQVGSTRLLSLIAKYPQLASVKDCIGTRSSSDNSCPDASTTTSWKNLGNISNLTIASSDSTRLDAIRSGQWVDIDSTKPERGQFRLAKYTPSTSGPGNVDMEGRVGQSGTGNTATNDIQTGSAKSDAEIYFTAAQEGTNTVLSSGSENIKFPGLWLRQGNGVGESGSCFNADRLVQDDNGLTSNSGVYGGNLYTVPLPVASGKTCSQLPNSAFDENKDKTALKIADFLPAKPTTGLIALGDVDDSLRLPRSADPYTTETINGVSTRVYRYSVDDIGGNGNNTINVETVNADLTGTGTAKTPQKVIFYLDGNINAGNGEKVTIDHTCKNKAGTDVTSSGCDLSNFVIYGYNTSSTAKICTLGNKEIEGFVIAPTYTVGGNSGAGGFKGAVWANKWSTSNTDCGHNSTKSGAMVEQRGSWNDVANWSDGTKFTKQPTGATIVQATPAIPAKVGLRPTPTPTPTGSP